MQDDAQYVQTLTGDVSVEGGVSVLTLNLSITVRAAAGFCDITATEPIIV